MNEKILEFILMIHNSPEIYSKIDILRELNEEYPDCDFIIEEIINEGYCPYCYETLYVTHEQNITELDDPISVT